MSVERVKVFTTTDLPHHLEKEVNEWLAKNNNAMIVSRQVTSTVGGINTSFPFITFTIFIFYRER